MEVSDVQRARRRIAEALAPTPLVLDHVLSERLGRRVWLKVESLQHTGSFKARGSLNWLGTARDEELSAADWVPYPPATTPWGWPGRHASGAYP